VSGPALAARRVHAEYLDEDDVDLVGVSEQRDGSGRQLILQRARRVSPQERALGLNQVAITDADSATVYGGVVGYTVTQQELILELTAEGAQTLGLPSQARIGLELSDEGLIELKAGLMLVFGDAV
jgi:hypothetical protein